MNLDLLRTFLEIYERRSLTRAAEALRVTQPSVSYALARLRRETNDALFVRTSGGMDPTARAIELYAIARAAVDGIDDVVTGRAFDPQTTRGRYRIALTDMGEYGYLPPLLDRLAREAPSVSVEVVPTNVDAIDRWVATGEVDAVIASAAPTGRTPSTLLFDEEYACLCSWPEGTQGIPVSAAELSSLRMAVIDSSSGHDRVARALEHAGITAQEVLRVHHFSTVPEALVRSGAAAIVPRRLAVMFARRFPLSHRPLGDLIAPFEVRLFANAAQRPSPGRQWFLALLEDVVREFAATECP